MLPQLIKDLKNAGNPEKAKNYARFFKTGKGEYGEGDVFIGVVVPKQHEIAKKYRDLGLVSIQKLLSSRVHEHRITANIILCGKYSKADEVGKEKIFRLYLKNTKKMNNWDLVDCSAPYIVGMHLLNGSSKDRSILYKLARSQNLWEKRISIISTAAFIRENDFKDTLKIAEILLHDKHDLIHKAVGWMLREVGKRNQRVEEQFLKTHYKTMPRTMLRYAIEKFDEKKRKRFLMK